MKEGAYRAWGWCRILSLWGRGKIQWCWCTYLNMTSRGKYNGDMHPPQMKPLHLQAALVSTDEVLGKKGNKENEHSKLPLPFIWDQGGKGSKGYNLRTVAHIGSRVWIIYCPDRLWNGPRLWAQTEAALYPPSLASSSFISFASWSSLAISSGIFCRKEVAVAGSVHLKQFVGLTLSPTSHEPSKFRAQQEMCLH